MEKTNLEIIIEILTNTPMRSGEIEEVTSIPRSTLSRSLKTLMDDGLIKNEDGFYKIIRQTPSVKDIYDKMHDYHKQRLMDYKYRKLKTDDKLDVLLTWFIDSPNNLKGKIEEYNYQNLEDNITKASKILKQSI